MPVCGQNRQSVPSLTFLFCQSCLELLSYIRKNTDNLVKYNISGVGALYIEIPCLTADAQLCWEGDYLDETFVVYLRTCFQQGGFRDEPPLSETELAYVTKELLPI